MKKFITFLTLQLVLANLLLSQKSRLIDQKDNVTVDCRLLDANTIRSNFCNDGRFNNPIIWPNGTNNSLVFATGIWLGAKVGNDTLVAIASYSSEYLPGYTDNNGIPHGNEDPLYRVYKLILNVNNEDRMLWPNILLGNSDQGAPIYFDSSSMTFKPYDYSTQTMYYVYTDSYTEAHHNEAGSTAPLKADIKQLNFACDYIGPLGQIIFSEFKVINRSNQIWNNAYIAIWTDDDIEYSTDNTAACDTSRNLGYTYSNPSYGTQPVVGLMLIRGGIIFTGNPIDTVYVCRSGVREPLVGYKDLKLGIFNSYNNGQDPRNYRESYGLMSGFRSLAVHGDVRYLMSTGPLTIFPNDTQHIVIARLVARGNSILNSIAILRDYAVLAKRIYDYEFSCPPLYTGININTETVYSFRLNQNFPNPFNPVTEIRYYIAREEMVTLSVYNISGRLVAILVNERKSPGSYSVIFDASNHASGVYFYKLTAPDFTELKKMVLIK
jgi:type IX secretion system substrate protein